MTQEDLVNHPAHYVNNAIVIEPIKVLRHAPFSFGNALKYMFRAGSKENKWMDYDKAVFYLKDTRQHIKENADARRALYLFLKDWRYVLNESDKLPTIPEPEYESLESIIDRYILSAQTRKCH